MTLRFLLAGACAIALSGCVSFGPKAPKALITLSASAAVETGGARVSDGTGTVTILTPTVPAAIASVRVPVYDGAVNLSYVSDVAWNEAPARLMQRMISETIAAKTQRVVLDPRQFTSDPGLRLSGQLQKFGIDPARMEAVAVFDAQLSRVPGKVETRRFEARSSVTAIDATSVGAPMNAVANDLAAQIAAWIG
jgi:cholesterol transport system auxiliary component